MESPEQSQQPAYLQSPQEFAMAVIEELDNSPTPQLSLEQQAKFFLAHIEWGYKERFYPLIPGEKPRYSPEFEKARRYAYEGVIFEQTADGLEKRCPFYGSDWEIIYRRMVNEAGRVGEEVSSEAILRVSIDEFLSKQGLDPVKRDQFIVRLPKI